jgi:hypothetical protein
MDRPDAAEFVIATCECPDCEARLSVLDGDRVPERCDCGAFYDPRAVIIDARLGDRDMDRVAALKQLGHHRLAEVCAQIARRNMARTLEGLK